MCQSYTRAHKLTHTLQLLSFSFVTTDRGLSGMLNPDKSSYLLCECACLCCRWLKGWYCLQRPMYPWEEWFIRRSLSSSSLHSTNQFLHIFAHTHIFAHKNFHTVAQRYICRWMSDTMAWNTDCGRIISSVIIWSEGLLKVTDKACKSQVEF